MAAHKDKLAKARGDFPYTKRETFTFEDGGKIFMDIMGDLEQSQRDILFVVPGLTSTSQSGYIRDITRQAHMDGDSKGYDVVVFNYRGLAGIDLYTPLLFCSNSYKDQLDPMRYIYEKYCKQTQRKCFAVGCSMGANILANILGYEGESSFITAACVVQAPIKKWKCAKAIKNNFYGIYDKALG